MSEIDEIASSVVSSEGLQDAIVMTAAMLRRGFEDPEVEQRVNQHLDALLSEQQFRCSRMVINASN